jgi:uncharacterized protein YjbI with pentapeptide repeats
VSDRNPLDVAELLLRYARGERSFRGLEMLAADLSDQNLREIDLERANLSGTNLSRANLSKAALSGATLSPVNLVGANLVDADLCGACLEGADFTGANLAAANLSGASLRGADLTDAILTGADLSYADLRSTKLVNGSLDETGLEAANLTGAVLQNTTFAGARMAETILGSLDLRGTANLSEVRHGAPSLVDNRTLELSRGRIDSGFLRGVGFLDWEIEARKLHDPGLQPQGRIEVLYEMQRLMDGAPVSFFSVFISHSSSDEEFCRKLHRDLQNNGVRCWFAPEDLRSGQKLHTQIERGIHLQERLLLVLSEASIGSRWVENEIRIARRKAREQKRPVLFPIRLVSYETLDKWRLFDSGSGDYADDEVREFFIPDFSDWKSPKKYEEALSKLVADLKT